MITRVVHPFNLQKALEHVIANKDSAGGSLYPFYPLTQCCIIKL